MPHPRRLHTRIKAVMDAVKAGGDIPDALIPKICKDPVFVMICEACQHVKKPSKKVSRVAAVCPDCEEVMCETHGYCHNCEGD